MGEENRAKTTFNKWYEQHKHVFGDGEIDVEADEQNQEYYQAYKSYEAVVEAELQEFMAESGINYEQFEYALY